MNATGFRRCLWSTVVAFLVLSPIAGSAMIMENFTTAPDPDKWTLSGFAAWDSDYQALFLTDASNDQSGSIFWSEKLSGQKFNIEFDFWIGAGNGADGMVFAWVRGPNLLGGGGGSMGFDGLDGYGVRFDTYTGGAPEPENYIAISSVTPSARTDLITNSTIPEMEDAGTAGGLPAPFHVSIKFNNGHLEMWMRNETAATPMPETKVFDYEIAGYTAFDAYFGFTAATGGLNNVHAIDNIVINRGAYAGDDTVVWAGDPVTLDGSQSYNATSYKWTQILGEPKVTLDNPTPADGISHFTAPPLTVGTVLTFQLDIESPDGPSSDTVVITIRAKNKPMLAPTNLQTLRINKGFVLSWGPLIDADSYVVEVEAAPTMWFPYATPTLPTFTFQNQPDGQLWKVRIRAANDAYGESDFTSEIVSLVILRNLALPPPNTTPPLAHVQGQTYVISHYAIAGMNNSKYDDNNDSWNGQPKSEDFWGYLWASPLYFQHIVYYQGDIFSDGGWWTDLKVQYTQDGTTWQDVHGLAVSPPYDFTDTPAAHTPYARYDITFVRVNGVGVRIFGTPGGTADFTSISELEVYGNQDPTAAVADPGLDRGEQEGASVTLNAKDSQNAVTYQWKQISGPAVTLTNADKMEATFTAPSGPPVIVGNTDLVFLLTVTDSKSRSSSAPLTITVIDADAVTALTTGTDTTVREGAEGHLVGSASIHGVNFKWTQTAGPKVIIADDTLADITFRAPPVYFDTTLTFQLHVDNGPGQHSDTATVSVRVLDRDGAVEVSQFDMTSVFNRDGIWSITVGDQPGDGFDQGGDCLVEDGYNGWPGLPSDGKVQDFQLGDFNNVNMLSIFSGDGDKAFDLAATGQQGKFQKLRFLTGTGNGYGGTSTDKLAVQLVYQDASTQEFLLLSQDWYLGSPPRTPPSPLTLGISGMLRASGGPSSNFGLFAFEFDQVDPTKTLTRMVFMEGDPRSTIGDPSVSNRFNIMAITGYPPSGVAGARLLPSSYQAGTNVSGEIYVYLDPAQTPPTNLVVTERFPATLSVVNAGGGTPAQGSITWTFSGAQVQSRVLSYTLGIPGTQSGAIQFPGTLAYGPVTDQPIGGDQGLYMIPSAPQNLDVEMLLAAYLSWTAPPEEGVTSYRIFRSVDGTAWDEIAFITAKSYVDYLVVEGSAYRYKVAAVNRGGAEGPASPPSDEKRITMETREAENFNFGGGQWPGYQNCPKATEATAADQVQCTNDFWHPNKGGPRDYRPNDAIGIETVPEADNPSVLHTNIGWIDAGSWYKYTFNVPVAGPGDPPGGWIKLTFRVASPSGGVLAAYWDDNLVGTTSYITGNWHLFTYAPMEEQIQTTSGIHVLRVESVSGQLNLDKIGVGFNWTPPKRQAIFEDDFESYATLYSSDDIVAGGKWTIQGTAGALGAWRLWITTGDKLGDESPDLADVDNKYAITDTDLAGAVDADEQLITKEIDCTEWIKLRLNFDRNYRAYLEDAVHAQTADVDVRVIEAGVPGSWVNLLHLDKSIFPAGTDPAIDSASEEFDLSAYDGKKIQLRWRFYNANYDYWFAVDNVKLSGEKKPVEKGAIQQMRLVAGKVELSWNAFGPGNYTVEYTDDIAKGDWKPVTGTWPSTQTTWPGEATTGMTRRFYRVVSQ